MDLPTYDVLVVGSGAAGLTAAITAQHYGSKVLLIEKEDQLGGTTARSGGWLWVPGNPLAKKAGVRDDIDAARRYIAHEAGNYFEGERVDAFLRYAGEMVCFVTEKVGLQFNFGSKYPDYHPDHPGGVEEGRSIHPVPFTGTRLGPLFKYLAKPMPESTFMGMGLNSGPDLKHFLNATRSLKSAIFVASRILEHGWAVLKEGRGTRLVNGNALAAALLHAASQRNMEIWRSAAATELLTAEGKVVGAVVERDGRKQKVYVRKGVILAAGGFPQDEARRRLNFLHVANGAEHATLAGPGSTGDGITLAEKLDAAVETSYPNGAAWVPVSLVKRRDGSVGRFFHLVDRAKPGVIAVTKSGRRFVNESENYHDFVCGMIKACEGEEDVSAYMICDHRAMRRYGIGAVRPAPLPLGYHLKSGYLKRGRTIAELARKIGADPNVLEETVRTVNRDALAGVDRQFGKGSTSYQRLLGDPDFAPNPCIGGILQAPFYAVKIIPGDIATYHGLKTDGLSRVLTSKNQPIAGLFAVGNDAASIFGGSYPGAGATLGPGMTFAYACGRYLAEL